MTLPEYELLIRDASAALGRRFETRRTPGGTHGGASVDALSGALSLAAIQRRGRWKSASSVARYEKHGRLLRQIATLSDVQLREASAAKVWASSLLPQLVRARRATGLCGRLEAQRPSA